MMLMDTVIISQRAESRVADFCECREFQLPGAEKISRSTLGSEPGIARFKQNRNRRRAAQSVAPVLVTLEVLRLDGSRSAFERPSRGAAASAAFEEVLVRIAACRIMFDHQTSPLCAG